MTPATTTHDLVDQRLRQRAADEARALDGTAFLMAVRQAAEHEAASQADRNATAGRSRGAPGAVPWSTLSWGLAVALVMGLAVFLFQEAAVQWSQVISSQTAASIPRRMALVAALMNQMAGLALCGWCTWMVWALRDE